MQPSRRVALTLLLLAFLPLASACRESAATIVPTTSPTTVAVPEATPTSTPEARVSANDLDILVLSPGDLGAFATRLMLDWESGWLSNELVSWSTWDAADSEYTWDRIGRRDGYWLGYWAQIAGVNSYVSSSVSLFRDAEAAEAGYDRLIADSHDTEAQEAEGFRLVRLDERPLEGVGDEAVVQVREWQGGVNTAVLVRRGPLVGDVSIDHPDATEAEVEELARALLSRFDRAIEGSLVDEPVPLPREFRPWARPPTPAELADVSLRTPTDGLECPGQGQRVCLMALGNDAGVDLDALAQHFRATYDLQISVMPEMSLAGWGVSSPDLVDQATSRLEDRIALDLIADSLPLIEFDDEVTLIVLTPYDLHSLDDPQLNYFYRARLPEGRMALLSTARLNDAAYGLPANPDTLWSRTLKIVTREIGLMHYELPYADASDWSSVMQEEFGAPWTMDFIEQDLPLAQR